MPKEAALAAPAPLPVKKRKWLALTAGVLLCVTAAGGGYVYWSRQRAAAPAGGAEVKAARKARMFATLDPFTVNLRGTGSEHFLQTSIVFEVSGTEVSEAIKANMPLIRGKALLLLSSKTAEDLATTEGKVKLAAELVAVARYAVQGTPALGSTPPEKAITDAHFSSMIIQ